MLLITRVFVASLLVLLPAIFFSPISVRAQSFVVSGSLEDDAAPEAVAGANNNVTANSVAATAINAGVATGAEAANNGGANFGRAFIGGF